MSIDYQLYLSTALEPLQSLNILSKSFDFEWSSELPNPWLFREEIVIGSLSDDEPSIMEEAFGFRPTIYVWFRVAKNQYGEKGFRTMLQAVMELLRQITGDAVFLSNGEVILFQRLGGQLLLNEQCNSWITSYLPLVTLPYEVRNLPSPWL
ncbi:SitI3 family protein [Microseira sp. BLCC-F43]|jgi:hypothetical protein|uniref:SitI3 family protein n=1 Tax=Microseira sp. BLCC-F43 TaxID=3153602 RepID=UPI0035BA25EB